MDAPLKSRSNLTSILRTRPGAAYDATGAKLRPQSVAMLRKWDMRSRPARSPVPHMTAGGIRTLAFAHPPPFDTEGCPGMRVGRDDDGTCTHVRYDDSVPVSRANAAASGTTVSRTRAAESTPGIPAPGCVPPPLKYRCSMSSLALCGRK